MFIDLFKNSPYISALYRFEFTLWFRPPSGKHSQGGYCQKQDVWKQLRRLRLQEKQRKRHGRKLWFIRVQKSISNVTGNDSQMQYSHTSTKASSDFKRLNGLF